MPVPCRAILATQPKHPSGLLAAIDEADSDLHCFLSSLLDLSHYFTMHRCHIIFEPINFIWRFIWRRIELQSGQFARNEHFLAWH